MLVAQKSAPSLSPVPDSDDESDEDGDQVDAQTVASQGESASEPSPLELEPPAVPDVPQKDLPPEPSARTPKGDQGQLPTAPTVEELPTSENSSRLAPEIQKIHDRLNRMDREQQQKLRAIRDKMAKVQQLAEQKSTPQPRGRSQKNQANRPKNTDSGSVPPPSNASRITEADLKAAEERLRLIKPKAAEEPPPPPTDWKTGTVDKMALADSLFVSGKADLAENSYKELAAQSLTPTDRVWVIYQLAGCSRIRGDYDTAMRLYRQIAAGKTPEELYWGERSLWWLRQLDWARKLKERQATLAESIKELESKTNELRAPKTL